MCASYSLDPRFRDPDDILHGDRELLDGLRSWASTNAGATLLPTGKNARNLNPIVRDVDGRRELELAWWGYLVDGEPASLLERGGQPARAIVPATAWFEMQKPQRQWFQFSEGQARLFAMAAVTRPGRTSDGAEFTCYSLVMRPAQDRHAAVHDRSPLVIPAAFVGDWLTSSAATRELVDAALRQSETALDRMDAEPIAARP